MAELAARQHGVVARRQLLGLGLGRRAIDHRLAVGRLHVVHRGVYAVGHRLLSRDGRWMAAVLAGGPEAVLSHRSAAALWGIGAEAAQHCEVTVAVTRRDRPGVRQHCSALMADESTRVRGVPVTTAARTLLDLAAVIGMRELRRAVHEAEVRRLWDATSLAALSERHPGRRGAAALRSVLADLDSGVRVTRSELEARFLELVAAGRLPPPRTNMPLSAGSRAFEADFVWPQARVIVELDGYATHGTRTAFERDRERDRALQAAGWRLVRVTWRQMHDRTAAVLDDLRTLLAV